MENGYEGWVYISYVFKFTYINNTNKYRKIMNVVYFQPKGMNPKYCEVGMINETDKEHIWYMYEPCKILISEVKIIPNENVFFNKKTQTGEIKKL